MGLAGNIHIYICVCVCVFCHVVPTKKSPAPTASLFVYVCLFFGQAVYAFHKQKQLPESGTNISKGWSRLIAKYPNQIQHPKLNIDHVAKFQPLEIRHL